MPLINFFANRMWSQRNRFVLCWLIILHSRNIAHLNNCFVTFASYDLIHCVCRKNTSDFIYKNLTDHITSNSYFTWRQEVMSQMVICKSHSKHIIPPPVEVRNKNWKLIYCNVVILVFPRLLCRTCYGVQSAVTTTVWIYLFCIITLYNIYSISQEICTRFLLCCALLWLFIDWFSHIHQAYFTGTVAI